MQEAKYSAKVIAKVILRLFDRSSGDLITPLYLQKLLYYVQAWALVLNGAPLFNEDFEAWAHGPVVPEVYAEYKGYGFDPIPEPVKWRPVDRDTLDHISTILKAYSQYSAKQLEAFTHDEDPWISARNGCAPGERCRNIITKESMRDFYTTQTE